MAALDTVVIKLRRAGAAVELVGLNPASQAIVAKLGTHQKPGLAADPAAH